MAPAGRLKSVVELRVVRGAPALSHAAARAIAGAAEEAIRARGRFVVALAGGETPLGAYRRLAGAAGRRIDWRRVHVFFGDERRVPPNDPGSNFGRVRAAWLARVPIPAGAVHRLRGEAPDAAAEARRYERAIRAVLGGRSGGVDPSFDLVVLGVGADGHTASLFPRGGALRARRRWVVPARAPEPPIGRYTLTLPAILSARRVLVLASGASKVAALAAIRRGTASGRPRRPPSPIEAVIRRARRVECILDRAAAGRNARRARAARPPSRSPQAGV